jgi:hypothetical protein
VEQTTELGIPAPNAACLAGACPKFALRTLPKKTSCTSDGSTFALLRAATRDMKNSSGKGQKKPFKNKACPSHEAEKNGSTHTFNGNRSKLGGGKR